MGDGDRLRILAAGIAGGGVAHMTDSHRAGHVVQNLLIEHGADQTGVLMAVDHAVFVYGDTGSLLTAVLECAESVVHISGNIAALQVKHSKYAAFLTKPGFVCE